jgi:hypothetical protein
MNYSIKWTGFGLSHSLARTVVHFFPSSPNVSAPYQVNTKLQVFSTQIGDNSLTLEGARLHQPDGVRLEAAFPSLLQNATGGVYGITVEVAGAAQRIDLSSSQCIIEIITANGRIRYRAKPNIIGKKDPLENQNPITLSLYNDSSVKSSLVMVNLSEQSYEIDGLDLLTSKVAPKTVTECKTGSSFFNNAIDYQSEKDMHSVSGVKLPSLFRGNDFAVFMLERDISTDRVISIANIE